MLLYRLSNLSPTHGSHTLSVPPLIISACDWFYITYCFFPAPQIWLEMLSLANRISWPSYLLQEGPSRSLSCSSCSEEEGKEGQISSASFSQSLPGSPYECFLSIFFCSGCLSSESIYGLWTFDVQRVLCIMDLDGVGDKGSSPELVSSGRPHWIPQLPVPDIQLCFLCVICKMRVSINISILSFQKCSGGLGVVPKSHPPGWVCRGTRLWASACTGLSLRASHSVLPNGLEPAVPMWCPLLPTGLHRHSPVTQSRPSHNFFFKNRNLIFTALKLVLISPLSR